MANKFYGAIALLGGTTGALDNINDSVLTDGDGGYVITDSERIYIYHYDSADASVTDDSPRVIKPDTIGAAAGSFVITEAVVKNVLMATNNAHLKGMTTADAEVSLIGINASDDTILTAIAGQSVDVTITGTGKVADFAAAGLTLAAGATISEFSIDDTLAGDSDTAVPTEQAVKAYVDNTLAAGYVTLTGVQTLTNKTLTSPIINTINTASGKAGATFAEDGAAVLLHNEVAALGTEASGAYVKDTSGSVAKFVFRTDASAELGYIQMSTTEVGLALSSEYIIRGAIDGTLELYYDNTIQATTESGYFKATNALNIAGDGATVTGIKDEDNMASNSAVKLATQQSIKAYVDGAIDTDVATHAALTATHGVAEVAGTADIATHAALTASHGVAEIAGTADIATHAALTATHGVAVAVVGTTDIQTLTNKTLTSPVLNTGLSGTAFLDEDNMASDSATKVASQQSIKAYVDAQIDADVATHAALTATHGVAGAIVGTTDSQTLTNKTLTSPVLNTGVSGTAFLDEDNMASNSATKLASQQSIKAYADTKTDAYYETFGALTTWTVNHNLGVANVSVKAIVGGIDVTGTYDEPTITMVTANQCTVVFTVATAGDVVCIA